MTIIIPQIIQHFYFDFHWDNRKVWQLDAPIEAIKVSELEWQLTYPIWSASPPQPLFNLCPMDVILDANMHPGHFQRMLKADFTFPIDLIWNKGKWVILDGFHRLARAKYENLETIQGRRHSETAVGLILRS